MSTITFKRVSYTLDPHGFLDPAEQWDKNFAEGMAKVVGIKTGLTDRHWQLIRYLRRKFLRENTVPTLVVACLENDMRLSELRSRFPTGYHRGACKVAGINYRFMCEKNYQVTYETAPPAKPRYSLDQLGFLQDFEQWDEDFADLALSQQQQPVTATSEHQRILRYLRDYYAANRVLPTVYETCSANGLSLKKLGKLFPSGYRRGACRAAGLPFFP